MTTPSLFKEYIWLVNTIKKAGSITFADIQAQWLDTEMSEGVELARSTFNRHKGTKAERIILRAYGKQRFYLNDLPLHHSQRLIAETEEYSEYAYYLRPTYDFCAHLLSLAAQFQIIEPRSLADI